MGNCEFKTILVVDDEKLIRDLIVFCLKTAGHRAIAAAGGNEALNLMGQYSVDLILLDYFMPEMDGLEFLRELATTSAAGTPVMMLTSNGERDVVLQSAQLGISDYILKNHFKPEDLLARVEKVLGKFSANQSSSLNQPSSDEVSAEASETADLEDQNIPENLPEESTPASENTMEHSEPTESHTEYLAPDSFGQPTPPNS